MRLTWEALQYFGGDVLPRFCDMRCLGLKLEPDIKGDL